MKKHLLFATLLSLGITTPANLSFAASNPAAASQASNNNSATTHLRLIRDEWNLMGEKDGLNKLFAGASTFQQDLLADIESFLALYNGSAVAAEALLIKGNMLYRQGDKSDAGVTWLQVVYEHPSSAAAGKAKQALYSLMDNDDWQRHTQEIKAILKNVPNKKRAARIKELIRQLSAIENPKIAEALVLVQLDFLKRFPTNQYAAEVQLLLAHNLSVESAESGIYAFKKLLALYPRSMHCPESMYAIAELQRIPQRNYEQAIKYYARATHSYPKHRFAKLAYNQMALTYEKDINDYPKAIDAYKKVIRNYSKDQTTLFALQHTAKIYQQKLDQPLNAVKTLRKIGDQFKGEDAIKALERGIIIADKYLEDPALSTAIKNQLIHNFPRSEEAPELLFEMAEDAADENNPKKATKLYKNFIQQYPKHKLATKARERM